MLSVILKEDTHTNALETLCHKELRGEEYEIVRADDWADGLLFSKGEFVCLLESNFHLAPDYFHDLLDVFLDQPSFRKMAMVAPATANVRWPETKKVYGFLVGKNAILPSNIKSSRNPYSIQVGYIPGAIIRKAVIKDLIPKFDYDPIMNSVRLCLHFWENGLRCLINPHTTYYTMTPALDLPILIVDELPGDIAKLTQMFRQEMIG